MITLISQRTLEINGRKVDSLEQTYVEYFSKFGIKLIPVPNVKESLNFYLKLPVESIILTGGGDIGDNLSKERDYIESALLDFAVQNKIPVLGICRGMQFINCYFGGNLRRINEISDQNHIAVNHKIEIIDEMLKMRVGSSIETNSYHGFGFNEEDFSTKLKVFAKSNDGVIEGAYHLQFPIAGILWHPERENPGKESDEIIKSFLNKQLFWKR